MQNSTNFVPVYFTGVMKFCRIIDWGLNDCVIGLLNESFSPFLCTDISLFFKSYEVSNKFALKFYITWNLYLFYFACLVLNIQRGDVTENVWQMILKFRTFSVVECHFIFQTDKNVLSQMFYFGMLNGNFILLEQVDE